MAEKLKMATQDLTNENIEFLQKRWPNVVVETIDNGEKVLKVDFELLKQELSNELVSEKQERYRMTWPTKLSDMLTCNHGTTKTLRPLPEKSVNFQETKNVYIEGDNLDALKILRETYLERIKMIYIDPPYNTGSDFVYKDTFSVEQEQYLKESGQIDDAGERMVANLETNGRFHSDWISMLYPRIKIAKDFLSDDGVIFISVDDHEIANLLKICNEIFGESNFIGALPRVTKKSGKAHSETIAKNNDYLVIYVKNASNTLFSGVAGSEDGFDYQDEFVETRGKYKLNQTLDYDSLWYNPAMDFPIDVNGETFVPGGSIEQMEQRHAGKHNPKDWVWRWSKAKFDFGLKNGFIEIKNGRDGKRIYTKTYLNATIEKDADNKYSVSIIKRDNKLSSLSFCENEYSNDNAKKELGKLIDPNYFDFPKPVSLIKTLISLVDEPGMICMDFFSGSGTTAQAVIEQNEDGKARKWILVQLPEKLPENSKARGDGFDTICDIGEERIKKVGDSYLGKLSTPNFDTGFRVFKVDSSNMKDVYYNPNQADQLKLGEDIDNVKPDRTHLDLLFQVMLNLGVDLSAQIQELEIDGKKVFSIEDDYIVACFANEISDEVINQIAKMKPTYAVFKDSSFKNDSANINCFQILKTANPAFQEENLKVI